MCGHTLMTISYTAISNCPLVFSVQHSSSSFFASRYPFNLVDTRSTRTYDKPGQNDGLPVKIADTTGLYKDC